MSSWCTIESDPGVFTELIQKIGVKGVQVEEVYAIDSESLREFKPIYGLIFLFKWSSEKDQRACLKAEEIPQSLFFAHQIVNNACATQAILSVLMNIDDPKVELGKELVDFKELTMMLPPDIKGEAIGESELLRVHHNSFARPEPFVMEEKKATKEDDDVFHFISYVPKDGKLYELDGLKSGPILLGDCTTENWTDKIVPHIESRIARYQSSEIKFNLLAVVGDKIQLYSEQLSELQKQYAGVPKENVEQAEQLARLIEEYQMKIQDEKIKQQRWREENVRRRHNYIPFLVNLLKVLAEKKELLPLLEKGKERAQQRAAAKKEAASSSGGK